jgi:ribosomal protein S18 acetylase RimI-like enzyme
VSGRTPGFPPGTALREAPRPDDPARVEELIRASGFFNQEEVEVAGSLIRERQEKGPASGYELLFLDEGPALRGYTCYGQIPGAPGRWDLYWIAVDPAQRGLGLGRALLRETERRIAAAGGVRIYVETGGRAQYAPTRAFYLACGYREEARLRDFYADGDDKVIYVRDPRAPLP